MPHHHAKFKKLCRADFKIERRTVFSPNLGNNGLISYFIFLIVLYLWFLIIIQGFKKILRAQVWMGIKWCRYGRSQVILSVFLQTCDKFHTRKDIFRLRYKNCAQKEVFFDYNHVACP